MAQKKIAKAKNTELEVMTSIKTSKLKTDLLDANKEVEVSRVSIKKLRAEKDKLEKELANAKENVMKK